MDGIMLSQVIVTAHREKSRPSTDYGAVGRHNMNLAVQAAESIVKHSFNVVALPIDWKFSVPESIGFGLQLA